MNLLYNLQVLHSTANKSFIQKRHAFIEYETKIMQSIYNKLKTYFPAEIRRMIWQLTIENHNSISYNDIVVSSDNPRDCEEIYFRFQGGYKLLFELTYKGVPNNMENPYAYMEIPYAYMEIPYTEDSIRTTKELKEKMEMFHDVVRFEKQLDRDIDVFYTKLKSLYESTSKSKTD